MYSIQNSLVMDKLKLFMINLYNSNVSCTMKKYELTAETKDLMGITLFRIKALISFKSIEKGENKSLAGSQSNRTYMHLAVTRIAISPAERNTCIPFPYMGTLCS